MFIIQSLHAAHRHWILSHKCSLDESVNEWPSSAYLCFLKDSGGLSDFSKVTCLACSFRFVKDKDFSLPPSAPALGPM